MIDSNKIAILGGMPRAATTFLYHNLNLHPELFVPFRRKTNYFSLHHAKGEDWFFSHFENIKDQKIAIDTETLAFLNSGLSSPQRIKRFNENAKIILIIREPAAWAVSLYKQIATFDRKIPDFNVFLKGGYTIVEDGVALNFAMKGGDIANRIIEYRQLFPSTLLIIKFKDITEEPLKSLKEIERFLGLSSFFDAKNIITKKINASNRMHSKLLGHILRNRMLINFIRNVVPRRIVLAIRWGFDAISSRHVDTLHHEKLSESDRKKFTQASDWYREDIRALSEFLN